MSLQIVSGWHWLILAIVLFAVGFLTRMVGFKAVACGALLVALSHSVAPIDAALQALVFIATTIVAWIFWKTALQPPSSYNLTDSMARRSPELIGARASLMTPIKARYGRVQLKDALWTVTCDEYVPRGQVVEVVGHTGAVLHVVEVK